MTPLISYDGYLNSIELPSGIVDQVRRFTSAEPLEAHISGNNHNFILAAEISVTEEVLRVRFHQDAPLSSGLFEFFLSTPDEFTDSLCVLVPGSDQIHQLSQWQAAVEAQFRADQLAQAGDTSAMRYALWQAGELFLQSKAYESAVDSWWDLLESLGPLPTAPVEDLTTRSPFEHTFALGQVIIQTYRHLGSVSAQKILDVALEVLPIGEGMDVWLIAAATCLDSSFSSIFVDSEDSEWPWIEKHELPPSANHELAHARTREFDAEPNSLFLNMVTQGTSVLNEAAAWVNASSDSSAIRLHALALS